jgi:hypothetical protein
MGFAEELSFAYFASTEGWGPSVFEVSGLRSETGGTWLPKSRFYPQGILELVLDPHAGPISGRSTYPM